MQDTINSREVSMKLGDRVTVENRLKRESEYVRTSHFWVNKTWEVSEMEPTEGIFLGWRTLSNGRRYSDYTYKPTGYLKAALVCTSEHENPFYATAIQEQS